MIVNSNNILKMALKDGYAVPAYNINNLEWAKFILEACSDDRSPVILAVTEGTIDYLGGYKVVYNMIKSLVEELKINIPVVIHLDHGSSVSSCKEAVDAGFTSVMLDVSTGSLEDNINATNEVIKYATNHDVSVEAELGEMNDEESSLSGLKYTSLDDACEFTSRVLVNSLAPSIGNAHGVYKKEANFDFELLGSICKKVRIPLVLHGASGVDDNKIKTAIFCGVAKININTDLQVAWSSSVKRYLSENIEAYDPRKIIKSGEKEMKSVIHRKNELIGSKNKA